MAKKTPTGISLEQLVQSITKQGGNIPDSLKSVLEEHGSTKAKRMAGMAVEPAAPVKKAPKANTVASGTTSVQAAPQTPPEAPRAPEQAKATINELYQGHELDTDAINEMFHGQDLNPTKPAQRTDVAAPQQTQSKAQPKGKRRYTARRALAGIVHGMGLSKIAEKLKKPDMMVQEHLKQNNIAASLKAIRMDLKEIKDQLGIAHTERQKTLAKSYDRKTPKDKGPSKPTSGGRKINWTKRGVAAFVHGATGGKVNLKSWAHATKKAERVEKPHIESKKGVEKVTPEKAKVTLNNLRTELQAPDPAKIKPVAKSDQQIEADEQSQQAQAKRDKAVLAKLDEIEKNMDANQKKHSGILGMLATAIPLIIAGINKAWKVISNIMGHLAKWGASLIKDVSKSLMKFGSMMFRGIAKLFTKVTGAIWGAMKGGWEKLKNLGKDIAGAAEHEAGKVVGKVFGSKELAKTGAKLLAKDTIKAIPLVGAAAGLGFAAYDLFKGNYADAGMDAASGLVSTIPGVGTGASLAIDAAQAAYDIKKDLKGSPAPSLNRAPSVPQEHLKAATAQKVQQDREASKDPKVVVIQGGNTTKVIPAPRQSQGTGNAVVFTRNPESSISRLNSQLFDDPSGWGALSRL